MAKKFTPAYSPSDIIALYKQKVRDGDEARLRLNASMFRTYTRMDQTVYIPKQYQAITKEVKTPFIRDAHTRISSSLVAKSPVAHATPKDDRKQEYRDAANIAERFDMAMIERFNKERGTDLTFNLAAQLVRDGESVLKVAQRPDAWANFPRDKSVEEQDMWKRGQDLPIVWRDVDRLCIVPEGGDYGDAWVIEYGEYTKPYLKQRYGMEESEGRLVNPQRMFEGRQYAEGLNPSSSTYAVKIEFFDAYEWHVLIDYVEAPGFPKPNPYAPHLPYFRAPAYESESLLYSLMFLVPRLDELLTMKLNWGALSAYPNPVVKTLPNSEGVPSIDGPLGDAGDDTANGNEVVWTPGKMIVLPPGKDISFLIPPPTGKDLNDLITIFKSLIDIAGIPSIMRGAGMSGDSGYLASQQRAAAVMAYKLATLSLQRQLEKATEFTHWLIEHKVKQTVYVLGWNEVNAKTKRPTRGATQTWLGLSPDKQSDNVADLSKVGPISYQYRPTLPTDEQARAMIALQLTNAAKPLLDRRHAIEEYLQAEDPDSILEALLVESAMEKEPLASQILEEALRRSGMLPAPEPQNQLVGPTGLPIQSQPLLPPPPGMIQNVPLANMPQPGMPGVPGITMPMQPAAPPPPVGIPGNVGGRAPGTYPGQPGGPNR